MDAAAAIGSLVRSHPSYACLDALLSTLLSAVLAVKFVVRPVPPAAVTAAADRRHAASPVEAAKGGPVPLRSRSPPPATLLSPFPSTSSHVAAVVLPSYDYIVEVVPLAFQLDFTVTTRAAASFLESSTFNETVVYCVENAVRRRRSVLAAETLRTLQFDECSEIAQGCRDIRDAMAFLVSGGTNRSLLQFSDPAFDPAALEQAHHELFRSTTGFLCRQLFGRHDDAARSPGGEDGGIGSRSTALGSFKKSTTKSDVVPLSTQPSLTSEASSLSTGHRPSPASRGDASATADSAVLAAAGAPSSSSFFRPPLAASSRPPRTASLYFFLNQRCRNEARRGASYDPTHSVARPMDIDPRHAFSTTTAGVLHDIINLFGYRSIPCRRGQPEFCTVAVLLRDLKELQDELERQQRLIPPKPAVALPIPFSPQTVFVSVVDIARCPLLLSDLAVLFLMAVDDDATRRANRDALRSGGRPSSSPSSSRRAAAGNVVNFCAGSYGDVVSLYVALLSLFGSQLGVECCRRVSLGNWQCRKLIETRLQAAITHATTTDGISGDRRRSFKHPSISLPAFGVAVVAPPLLSTEGRGICHPTTVLLPRTSSATMNLRHHGGDPSSFSDLCRPSRDHQMDQKESNRNETHGVATARTGTDEEEEEEVNTTAWGLEFVSLVPAMTAFGHVASYLASLVERAAATHAEAQRLLAIGDPTLMRAVEELRCAFCVLPRREETWLTIPTFPDSLSGDLADEPCATSDNSIRSSLSEWTTTMPRMPVSGAGSYAFLVLLSSAVLHARRSDTTFRSSAAVRRQHDTTDSVSAATCMMPIELTEVMVALVRHVAEGPPSSFMLGLEPQGDTASNLLATFVDSLLRDPDRPRRQSIPQGLACVLGVVALSRSSDTAQGPSSCPSGRRRDDPAFDPPRPNPPPPAWLPFLEWVSRLLVALLVASFNVGEREEAVAAGNDPTSPRRRSAFSPSYRQTDDDDDGGVPPPLRRLFAAEDTAPPTEEHLAWTHLFLFVHTICQSAASSVELGLAAMPDVFPGILEVQRLFDPPRRDCLASASSPTPAAPLRDLRQRTAARLSVPLRAQCPFHDPHARSALLPPRDGDKARTTPRAWWLQNGCAEAVLTAVLRSLTGASADGSCDATDAAVRAACADAFARGDMYATWVLCVAGGSAPNYAVDVTL